MPFKITKVAVHKSKAALVNIYRECFVLNEFVNSIRPDLDCDLNPRIENYCEFLHTTIIAFSHSCPPRHTLNFSVSGRSWVFSNVAKDICTPYDRAGGHRQAGRFFGQILPFEGTFRTPSATPLDCNEPCLKWNCWNQLQDDIGDEMFLFIIRRCSIFVTLSSGQIFQIIGDPIVDAWTGSSVLPVTSLLGSDTTYHEPSNGVPKPGSKAEPYLLVANQKKSQKHTHSPRNIGSACSLSKVRRIDNSLIATGNQDVSDLRLPQATSDAASGRSVVLNTFGP